MHDLEGFTLVGTGDSECRVETSGDGSMEICGTKTGVCSHCWKCHPV